MLETTTEPPPDALDWRRIQVRGFLLFVPRKMRLPDELHLQLRGGSEGASTPCGTAASTSSGAREPASAEVGEQLERVAVGRLHGGEVPVVERGDLRDADGAR